MIEQELKAGLDLAVADEPPLAFDADRLIATAHRQSHRRRALAGVSAGTAAVAVAAIALPNLLHGGESHVAAAAPSSTISTAPPSSPPPFSWPPAGIRVRTYDATQLNALTVAWTHELKRVFPALVPQARDISVGGLTDGLPDTRNFTDLLVHFTVHGKATAASIEIYAPGADRTGPAARCAVDSSHSLASSAVPPPGVVVPPDTCQVSRRGDTALVREAQTAFVPDTSTPTSHLPLLLSVTQFRTDGSVVGATAYNYDPTGHPDVTMAQPPLTNAQLTTLATDPALSF
jgi:hypothetical protein